MKDEAIRSSGGAPGIVEVLRLVVDSLTEPMMVIDADFQVVLSNRAARGLNPMLSKGEAGPLCCHVLHGRPSPCADTGLPCPLRQAAEQGRGSTVRHEHLRPDGDRRLVEIIASPLLEADGRFYGILQIVRDVTDVAKTEEVLSRARNEWVATADSVPDLIFLTDLEGRIIRCNRAAKGFLAKDYREIIGLGLRDALQPLVPEGSALDLERGELTCERPRATLEVASYPAHLEGRPYGTVWVMRDVTAVRRLESIASSVDMMNNLGHVLAAVRHEIGNPINAIKTALSVLRESVDSFTAEKRRTYVDRCLEDIGRVNALLESLRTFNMFEAVQCEAVDLGAFLRRFAALVTEQLESQGIMFETSLTADSGAVVSADQRALQQVLLGLVSNASDAVAARKGARIVLETVLEGENARIAVTDNGVGIALDDVGLVFLPLFTTKPHGTGLGLAIARNLVTKMGGTMELRSRLGRGTRVEIVLLRIDVAPARA